jgi:hypothetical protein
MPSQARAHPWGDRSDHHKVPMPYSRSSFRQVCLRHEELAVGGMKQTRDENRQVVEVGCRRVWDKEDAVFVWPSVDKKDRNGNTADERLALPASDQISSAAVCPEVSRAYEKWATFAWLVRS